jgi:putative MATE family efflux protein
MNKDNENLKRDLTGTHLFKKMIVFTIPILLLSLCQLVFYSIDQMIVSNFGGGENSFAAVSSNNAIVNLLIGSFLGVSVGANVVLATALGKKDILSAQRIVSSAMVLSVYIGVAVAVIGIPISRYLLIMMATPSSVLDEATIYLQCCFIGMPFLMIFNFAAACFRAVGDSKRPLYVLVGAGIVNILLNLLFVLGLGMKENGRDVLGVGLATVISQVFEAAAVCLMLFRSSDPFIKLSFKGLRLYKEETKEVLKNGLTAGFQFFVFSLSNVLIQRSVNSYSDENISQLVAMNGNGAALQLESYISMVLKAFGVALVVAVAQNYGAGNKENLKKVLWISLLSTTALSLTMGGLAVIFYRPLLSIFLPKSAFADEDNWNKAIEVGHQRLLYIGLAYCVDAWMDNTAAYCRGLGHAYTPPIITFIFVTVYRVVFILAVWNNVAYLHTLPWLWSTWPISWALSVLAYWCFMPSYLKKAFKDIDSRSNSEKEKIPA